MKVTLEKAAAGLIAYMADQVAMIPNIGSRFLAYGALGALKANPSGLIAKLKPWMQMAGIVDEDGHVDLDMLKKAMIEAFANVPKVPYLGFTFTEEDAVNLLDKMHAIGGSV